MHFIRWLSLGVGALLLMSAAQGAAEGQAAEYVGSLLIAVAGAMLVAGAGDLVMLFLGLELISIPTYVLLYLGRRDAPSQEAALKYFYLSILSSAVMLYGFSFLYGLSGSMNLTDIQRHLSPLPPAELSRAWLPLAGAALVLVLAGLGFKMAAVPFHFYAPDVYQGTTHANAAVLAVIPKIAGVAALARVASLFAGADNMDIAWIIVLSLAVATMTVGNVLGLWQDNLRRLLAYSSIAHAGYLLIGIAVGFAASVENLSGGFDGVQAALFYVVVYALATIGAFATLGFLGTRERQIDDIHELAGLGQTRPLAALSLAVLLLSLAGIPPLAGFLGKLVLFYSAIGLESPDNSALNLSFIVLAVAGALNAAIAAGYYLRVIAVMYFGSPAERPRAAGGRGALAAAAIALALVIGLGLFPSAAMQSAQEAATALQSALDR
jgi:NADH-quinone oxidoreductase subunit N